ncbi:MAG: histidinol-phosphatase HisJ family protein [Ruminococcaceae bacterium]|nr:histidinol-phosphatase HisJ family protein [Oscillospiraceae bacterium]
MIESCVHTHTTFCDGQHTPEEMLNAACDLGLKCIGFSGHSYVDIDDFGIKPHNLGYYISEIDRLKKLHANRIDVMCGIELDSFSTPSIVDKPFDYIIASAHAVMDKFKTYHIIDGSVDSFADAAKHGFEGDFSALCRAYYEQLAIFVCKINPDIVGHFDLITKFNRDNRFFDEDGVKYKTSALDALDAVLSTDAVIEVNTGGINRGYRISPYPADFLLRRILDKKGKVIITTDAHSVEHLTANVTFAEELLKNIGFKTVCELSRDGFYERLI